MTLDLSDIIAALHVSAFGIRPTADTLTNLIDEVGDDPVALDGLASRLFRYAEVLRATARNSIADHSQNGELRIILREMMTIGKSHGMIVDVGALGKEGSNSYDLLSQFGWKGLLIEANPALIPKIRQEFGPVDYHLIECAVGMRPGRQSLHIGVGAAISSLIREEAGRWGAISGEVEVDVRRLQDVLAEAGIPHDFDILDLDIEGLDVAVLNDLITHSNYRPRLVLIEASYFFATTSLREVGLNEDVQRVYHILDRTAANLILGLRGDPPSVG